ncbi:uncharacterized protein LOC108135246 [Drosophila elegans]|uniref:uncharacterized protein LOC108135246 n=1 Tax=Drosophila elegans TaxID=30023 RepID=UPI0007E74EC7|nr:uncharacterized protein LOC108135246 [Drosophila elegans]
MYIFGNENRKPLKITMLELVMLFLLSSVFFFVAHLEKPTTLWGLIDATCPILMGTLAAGLIYINN